MQYRILKNSDEIIVLIEDGGIACIRDADEVDEGDGRQSVTDYYQSRFTQEMLDNDIDIWEELGEGKMYYNDWTTPSDDPAHIQDALKWLCAGCTEFTENTDLWPDFK